MERDKSKYKLPEGWIWTNLSELFVIIGGGTPTKNNRSYWGGNINWASVKDIKSQYLTKTEDKITEEGVANSNTKIASEGDLVLVTRISPGNVSIVKSNTAINQDLKILKLFGGINPSFAYFLLSSNMQKFIKLSSGTTVKGLKINDLTKIKIPLPPLKEQQRIVSKIDSLFSELEHAEKRLQKAIQQLKVYRHALLKSTFECQATKELKKYTELITKGASPKWQGINYTLDEKQVLFVTSENVQNNFIDLEKKKFVEREFNEKQKRSILQNGDVLINIVGASIGRAAIFSLNTRANINQAVSLIRLKRGLEQKFLSYFLNSPIANEYYQSRIVDVARANLSLKDISEIPIPIITLVEQREIIAELESRFTLIENLEKSINDGLSNVIIFRHSVLKKVFEGRLVEQNPNDEPSQKLLQKIKIEKEEYIQSERELEKLKPKKKRPMETKKTVLELLKETETPVSTQELWDNSIHEGDIESFYSEIKDIYEKLAQFKEGTKSFLSIRK